MEAKKVQLKIKIKSLAQEAKFIRKEEKKYCKNGDRALMDDLYGHRMNVVRPTTRRSLISYGFLRGKKYSQIEKPKRKLSNYDKRLIKNEVKRFSNSNDPYIEELIDKWFIE